MSRRRCDPLPRRAGAAAWRSAGRSSTSRPGAGERAQLLGPAERRRPAQPAGRRGVRDHPQEQRDGEHRAGDARAPCAASARAGWRPRRRRRTPAAARRARARGRPTGPTPARPARIPTNSASHTIAAPIAIPASAARNTVARGSPAGRGRAPGGRRPPRRAARARPRAGPTARRRSASAPEPPRHVAADGEQVVGHAVEQAHRAGCRRSCARAAGGLRASGTRCGRPRPARPSRRRNSSANEIVRVRASRSGRRASGASRRHGRPRRRSGAGRSPRGTARGC